MSRNPNEIRQGVQEARRELEFSLGDLRAKMREVSDWKKQLSENRQTALIVAGGAGFLVGGGIAGVVGLFKR